MGSPTDWKIYGDGASILAVNTTRVPLGERKGKQPVCLITRRLATRTGYEKSNKNENVYKKLLNYKLHKLAYELVSKNKGANTKGTTDETIDGFSLNIINKNIQELKDHSFKFKPIRRIYIPKKSGQLRPLGIPSPRDKVVQKVAARILEEIYEPEFLNSSHGFRPKRGTHTALREIRKWTGVK